MTRYIVCLLTLTLLSITACVPSVRPTQEPVPATPAAVSAVKPTPNPTQPPTIPGTEPFQYDPTVVNSSQAVEQVAKIIYDTLAANQDLKPWLKGVMTAFGVPPLGEQDTALATRRLEQGLPLFFIPQLAEMADAYKDGSLIPLDSFIAAANGRGAKQKGTDLPLTREYLTRKFAGYVGQAHYEDTQVLPAFVLALSRERAKHDPPVKPDPLWGDGLLDPLQVTLLLYSVSYAGADSLATPAKTPGLVSLSLFGGLTSNPMMMLWTMSLASEDPIGDFVKGKIRGKVVTELQKEIGIPLNKKDAARVSVCASLLLFGHKMKVTTTPNLLYHKDGIKPWTTEVRVELRFQDDYWSNYLPIDRWMIENLFDCSLPHRGPVVAQSLEWSVSDGLSEHGNFDVTAEHTDDNGIALASWHTVPETTPKFQRTFYNQRDAVGAILVRANGLVPNWPNLERIVNSLRDTGGVGNAPLTVIYYQTPRYRVDTFIGLYSQVPVKGMICDLEQPFTLQVDGQNPSGGQYVGDITFTPTDTSGGSWKHTATSCIPGYACGQVSGSGAYQLVGVAEGKPVLMMPATTSTSEVKGHVAAYDWPAWQIELYSTTENCSAE